MRLPCTFTTHAADGIGGGLPRKRQRRPACGRNEKENGAMFDLICVAIIILFFVVAASFARGCERLETEE
jgi:hypothetical protein